MADADLALILEDLINSPEVGFVTNSPILSHIVKANKIRPMDGWAGEFPLTYRGPSDPIALNSGYETYNYGSNNVLASGTFRPGRHIYPWGISNADFDVAGGSRDVIDVVQKKSEAALADFEDQMGYAIASGGDSSGATLLTGCPTFNGDATYTARGTTYTGMLQAIAPASQTASRFGISSATYNDSWHNQYQAITNWPSDGVRKLFLVIQACNKFGGGNSGSVDIGFADPVSFAAFLETCRDDFRITVPARNGLKESTATIQNTRESVIFGNVQIYSEPHLVLSRFSTGSSGSGLIQLFTSKQLFMASPHKVNKLFQVKEKKDIPGQDVRGFEIISDFTIYSPMLTKHGVLTNTNTLS